MERSAVGSELFKLLQRNELMWIEIENGELFVSSAPNEVEDIVHSIVRAERLEVVPLPPHPFPGTEVIAYCSADARGLRPNCTVEGYDGVIYGVLAIFGLDGDMHRNLTDDEVEVFTLDDFGPGTLPRLRVMRPTSD
jgi:hypothetical protein